MFFSSKGKPLVRLSLSLKMILSVSFLIIVVSVSLTCFAGKIFSGLQYQQVTRSMEKSRDDAASIISVTFQGYMKEINAIAQREEIASMNWDRQKPILAKEASRIGFECFLVGSITGEVVSTAGDRYSVGSESYYARALTGVSTISDLMYNGRYNKMVVSINCPIKKNGTTIGVLSAIADAAFMNEILNSIKLDYTGETFIINDGGYYMGGVDYNGTTELKNVIRSADGAPDKKYGQFAFNQIKMIQGGSGLVSFWKDGEEWYLSYSEMNEGAWHLGIIQSKKEAMAILSDMIRKMILLIVVFIAFGLGCVVLLSRSLKPLQKLKDSIEEIATGNADLTQRISVQTSDEIGDVVTGFNTFTGKLQSIMSIMKQSKESLVTAGENLKAVTGEALGSIEGIINDINDVGVQITNQNNSVYQTSSAVNEISSNISSLEKMVEGQSKSVTEASAAVEEMIGNISSVNASMAKMTNSFKALEEKASIGVEKQDDVSRRIEIVGEESAALNNANRTIQNITYQTNLLAMNAAIEAAHAGEAGRGFSVVADEIRKLSETSNEQSKTIKEQLDKIQNSINDIIKASQESRMAFISVSEEIKSTDRIVKEVTIAMEEQQVGSKQIIVALNSMNGNTSEVLSAVNEMTAGSNAILTEIKNLQDSTLSLKTGMSKMETGAGNVSNSGTSLYDISEIMENSIKEIGSQVDQFKV